ncbi:hypothetical protein BGZ95_004651 [Linnemannia exigua]|uniref:Uncharacterized protein n=1 Tax=Linnemannia exigua TaxID=604196 RepID=A0AAD4H200_9FUNG|nr:hypothetical protein BGZ95_004651 [Linnemannia exigua]
MNQLAESTRATINSLKAHALLSKAIANDPKPTPGYLFPEIAPLKILRQLAQSGSIEFRIQLARQGKGPLSEVVGYRGSWDEIHGDRLNEDIRTIAEDLIEYMHSNPVQDHEILEARQKLTAREAAVMQNSTQGLPGYGNPEYEDSDSDEDLRRSRSVLQETESTTTTTTTAKAKPRKKTEKKREDTVSPPLPGFGNPEFEEQKPQSVYIDQELRHPRRPSSSTPQTPRPNDPPAPAVTLPDIMLLDIGA